MKSLPGALRVNRTIVIMLAVLIMASLVAMLVNRAATHAAADYVRQLKAYETKTSARLTAISKAHGKDITATPNQPFKTSLAVAAFSIDLQKTLDARANDQPRLRGVPFGFAVRQYVRAADVQADVQRQFKTVAQYNQTVTYYYSHVEELASRLRAITTIGVGTGAQLRYFKALANVAPSKEARQQLSILLKETKSYTDEYRKLIQILPLPPQYAGERSAMRASADGFDRSVNAFNAAYVSGDRKRIRTTGAVLDTYDGGKYNFIKAATAPYGDPKKLKNPLQRFYELDGAVTRDIQKL